MSKEDFALKYMQKSFKMWIDFWIELAKKAKTPQYFKLVEKD